MESGTILAGRYTIDALARIGGMSAVFRAHDSRQQPVAVKVLQLDMSQWQARFQREMHVLATLRHPHIVRYIDSGVTEHGQPFLVIEWLDGCDLESMLASSSLSVDETLILAERVAAALAFAHQHHVVHRDVKPGNIFLPGRDVGAAKLLDFGLARWRDQRLLYTQPGTTMGTPAYMSPEQARGDREIDGRADLFSLGCVLFECLAGRPPFIAPDPTALQFKILFEETPRVDTFVPNAPAAVVSLIHRLLAKAPEERPASSSILLSELGELRAALVSSTVEDIHSRRPRRQSITRVEERLVSVVVATAPNPILVAGLGLGQTAVFLEELPRRYWNSRRPQGADGDDAAAGPGGTIGSGAVATTDVMSPSDEGEVTMPTIPIEVDPVVPNRLRPSPAPAQRQPELWPRHTPAVVAADELNQTVPASQRSTPSGVGTAMPTEPEDTDARETWDMDDDGIGDSGGTGAGVGASSGASAREGAPGQSAQTSAMGSTELPAATMPVAEDEQRQHTPVTLMEHASLAPHLQGLCDELQPRIASLGAKLAMVRDGSLMAVLDSQLSPVPSTAVDQAVAAVRCGLLLREALPEAAIAIATGRTKLERWQLMGEAIDAAVALATAQKNAAHAKATAAEDTQSPGDDAAASNAAASNAAASNAAASNAGTSGIRIDELTARLVQGRVEVGTPAAGVYLIGDDAAGFETTHSMSAGSTSFVGRTTELTILHSAIDECVQDEMARAIVLTGAAGIGKSRLCSEFLRTVETSGRDTDIWYCHGDPLYTSSPLAAVADAIRAATGIMPGEPAAVGRAKLRAYAGERMASVADAERVFAFVGELLQLDIGGIDEDGEQATAVQLRAARANASLMSDQMRRAVIDLIEASVRDRPLIWLIDDLHWCDHATLSVIDRALGMFTDHPFLVVGLSRPELRDKMPNLWTRRRVMNLRLSGLSRRAAERMIKSELGKDMDMDQAQIAAMIECAQGNPFYLGELVRGVAEGQTALPDTVMAMVHARLANMEPEARRMLRAASVFGQRFWQRAVSALVGERVPVDAWLDQLVDNDFIVISEHSRFPGDIEYRFCHWLIRDGAYDTLTGHDRQLAHRLAGEWLEGAGESDAGVIAEHFVAGQAPERALPHYAQAAEAALARGDLDAAVGTAERGMACQAEGALRGRLLWVRAQERVWRGSAQDVAELCEQAVGQFPLGERSWYDALGECCLAWGKLGQIENVAGVAHLLNAPPAAGHDCDGRMLALAKVAQAFHMLGAVEPAQAVLGKIERELGRHGDVDAEVKANIHLAHAGCPDIALDNKERKFNEFALCIRYFEEIGHQRQACLHRTNLAYSMIEMGLFAQAEALSKRSLREAERMGIDFVAQCARQDLAYVLGQRGELNQAKAMMETAIAWFADSGDRRLAANAHLEYAKILVTGHQLEDAELHVRTALEVSPLTQQHPTAVALLGRIALERGDTALAVRKSEEAMAALAVLDAADGGDELFTRVVHIEALLAVGRHAEASGALQHALDMLLSRADKIQRLDWKRAFLYRIREHARILELAQLPK